MIKTYLEQAIRSIEADKEKAVSEIKDRITREKIIPYNTEVDNYRAKALTEIEDELNQRIASIRQDYEAKKQELIRLGEEKKKANADNILMSELAVATVEYDTHIAKLNAQLAEVKE